MSDSAWNGPAESGRELRHYPVPVLAAAIIILGPALLHAVWPARTLGLAVLGVLGMTALILGAVDGRTFRSSWSFPLTVGAAHFAAMLLYFNEGTWIYLPAMVILAALGSWLGQAGRRRKR